MGKKNETIIQVGRVGGLSVSASSKVVNTEPCSPEP